ncbi:hypothetical protein CEV33_1529 [Brucella grignonensis]|uniref:Uncharacterized protein n=1 Tax=Brucella grignonensis TaxID=94627 RepID=A0A256FAT0_9HYPH|nr:hypothetical protein CEV33_1529 [Brucella grignonensis]
MKTGDGLFLRMSPETGFHFRETSLHRPSSTLFSASQALAQHA